MSLVFPATPLSSELVKPARADKPLQPPRTPTKASPADNKEVDVSDPVACPRPVPMNTMITPPSQDLETRRRIPEEQRVMDPISEEVMRRGPGVVPDIGYGQGNNPLGGHREVP